MACWLAYVRSVAPVSSWRQPAGVRGGERLRLAPTSVRLGIRTVVRCWACERAATNHGPLGRAQCVVRVGVGREPAA